LLVLGNRFSDGAGLVRFGCANPVLPCTLPQHHQAIVIQPAIGDVADDGSINDRSRAWSQADLVGEVPQSLDLSGNIELLAFDCRHQQAVARIQAGAGQLFVLVLDGVLINALFGSFAGPTEANGRSGQRLQFQANMLQDMRQVGAAMKPLEEASAFTDAAAVLDQGGQPRHQPLVEAGHHLGGDVFVVLQIYPSFQTRIVCPDVGASQSEDFPDVHGKKGGG